MTTYTSGDRVWVCLEGFNWWPARVITQDEFAEVGGTFSEGADLLVMFYEGITTERSISALNTRTLHDCICYFETSSEKAVTNDEELKAAIQHAIEDTSANLLKTAASRIGGAGGSGANAAAEERGGRTNARATTFGAAVVAPRRSTHASKRARADEEYTRASSAELGAAHPDAPVGYQHYSSETLANLAEGINQALATENVRALRKLLCELDNVDATHSELATSKIGVSIGNVLGNRTCQPLWPLARALISFWARHLPHETLDAIRRLQQEQSKKVKQDLLPTARPSPGFGSPFSTSSPTHFSSSTWPNGLMGSPTLTTTIQAPASPTQPVPTLSMLPPSRRNTFHANLCQLLDDPLCTTRISAESIEKIAKELAKEVQTQDERMLLLSRLRNPNLAFVRENLVTGKWTPSQYAEQPEEAFITQHEKEEEEQRVRQKLKAVEEAKLANVNFTSMFTCRNCKAKRCHYYEQQTRSADEPTTKFLSCLDCKFSWTEE